MALGTCGQSRLPVLRALRGDGVRGAKTLEKGLLESLGVSCTLKDGLDFPRKRKRDLKAAGNY